MVQASTFAEKYIALNSENKNVISLKNVQIWLVYCEKGES